MREILFEAVGIIVYAECGVITEADCWNAYRYEDTSENRTARVAAARRMAAALARG